MKKYNHKQIEKGWRKDWEEKGINKYDMDKADKPYFNLMMFPYPSAEGLHVGNMYAFTGSDIWGRYKKMNGYDVFEPIGLDGFGIHSENYAIKIGEHIHDVSKRTEKHFYHQLRMTGNQYDWSRTVETYKPDYYKWTQWLFVQMFKHGLAYRKKAKVNWCPSCKTVLSDEQVEGGICERCKTETVKKDMEQWFWKITEYAERLLKNLEWMDWSEDVKLGQKNWIGKSEGAELMFKIVDEENTKVIEELKVFTTRPDTMYGATFMVVAPEHKIIEKNKNIIKNLSEVETYIEKARKKSDLERTNLNKNKTGVLIKGIKAINPANGKKIPIFVADYVLISYGEGAIMGVPSNDNRDNEFAKKYKLEIVPVIKPPIDYVSTKWSNSRQEEDIKFDRSKVMKGEQVYSDCIGECINSDLFNGIKIHKEYDEIIKIIEEQSWGKKAVTYKLRDWCISRQRYWGPPIPMIYCKKCGWQPVPEKDLPVLLPDIEKYKDILPDGSGKGPLARLDSFYKVKCPKCGKTARRETDVSDPFVDSCWYFLRYPSTEFNNVPFDKNRTKKWLPVDMYIGGKEHTVLHLLYSRFITMALNDQGYIDFEEPFERFFGHGLLIKEGAKMSKSKGNVINPDEYIDKYGADAVRMYLMFLGDFEQGGDWRDTGMKGMYRFVQKVWRLFEKFDVDGKGIDDLSFMHKSIKRVGEEIEKISYNTAIAKIMEFVNWYADNGREFSKKERQTVLSNLALLMAPFAPFLSEELWYKLGNKDSIHQQSWPDYDKNLVKSKKVTIAVQINGKLRDTIKVSFGASKEDVINLANKSEKIKKYKNGKVKKAIFVENRVLNFVI